MKKNNDASGKTVNFEDLQLVSRYLQIKEQIAQLEADAEEIAQDFAERNNGEDIDDYT